MADSFLEEFKTNFIEKMNKNRLEIERKFLVKELPDYLWKYKNAIIEQHYVSFEPETRIRKFNDSYTLTFKSEGNLERSEVQIPITKLHFNELKEMSIGSVNKTRYFVPEGSRMCELDVYHNIDSLLTVEVEFDNREDSDDFSVPDWFGTEITNIKEFKNKNLARKGFPRALQCPACRKTLSNTCELCKGEGGLKITHVDLETYNNEFCE